MNGRVEVVAGVPRWHGAIGRSTHRPLSTAALIVYSVLLGLTAGLGSAYWMVTGDYPFGTVTIGPWRSAPRVGSREVDPYTRAVVARSGDIPLAIGEGLMLTATTDDAGRPLDARCTYRVGPVAPPARYWTLTAYDEGGHPIVTELQRSGFTSADELRDGDGRTTITIGRTTITIGRDATPGNWLRMPESGRIGLALRLYDTPVAAGSAALDRRIVPAIERLECTP